MEKVVKVEFTGAGWDDVPDDDGEVYVVDDDGDGIWIKARHVHYLPAVPEEGDIVAGIGIYREECFTGAVIEVNRREILIKKLLEVPAPGSKCEIIKKSSAVIICRKADRFDLKETDNEG